VLPFEYFVVKINDITTKVSKAGTKVSKEKKVKKDILIHRSTSQISLDNYPVNGDKQNQNSENHFLEISVAKVGNHDNLVLIKSRCI